MNKICCVCDDEIPEDRYAFHNSNNTWSCWKHLSLEQLKQLHIPAYPCSMDKPRTMNSTREREDLEAICKERKMGDWNSCPIIHGIIGKLPPTDWHSMKVEKPEPRREIYFVVDTNRDEAIEWFIFEASRGYRLFNIMDGDNNYVHDEDRGCKIPMSFILAWRYVRPEFTEDDLAAIRIMETNYESQQNR